MENTITKTSSTEIGSLEDATNILSLEMRTLLIMDPIEPVILKEHPLNDRKVLGTRLFNYYKHSYYGKIVIDISDNKMLSCAYCGFHPVIFKDNNENKRTGVILSVEKIKDNYLRGDSNLTTFLGFNPIPLGEELIFPNIEEFLKDPRLDFESEILLNSNLEETTKTAPNEIQNLIVLRDSLKKNSKKYDGLRNYSCLIEEIDQRIKVLNDKY